MKKLIFSTVALAAITFTSCKKGNLQPTTNSTTNIEQTSLETADDEKAVDARNKFLGTWVGTSKPSSNYGNSTTGVKLELKITKYSTSKLKVVVKYLSGSGTTDIFYASLSSTKKMFTAKKTIDASEYIQVTGYRATTTGKFDFVYSYFTGGPTPAAKHVLEKMTKKN